MHDKFPAVILAAAILAAAAPAGAAPEKTAPAKPAAQPSLLRLELLKSASPPSAQFKRDIFSPGWAPAEQPAVAPPKTAPLSREGVPERVNEGVPAPAVRYIGFSRAVGTKKIIALVLFDGQPTAVGEGETLAPGYTVIRITPGEIQVRGPDGKESRFALEGAER